MTAALRCSPWCLALLAGSLSCGAMEAQAPAPTMSRESPAGQPGWSGAAPASPPPPAEPEMAMEEIPDRFVDLKLDNETDNERGRGETKGEGGAPSDPETPTRAWFPESFLFEPLLVTDAQGAAALTVRVPDQLTDWRVLALAHDREGSQAGAEARFASTLPVYLEVAEPPILRVGDRALLPLQVVSTQAEGYRGSLSARVEGLGARGAASGALAVDGSGSAIRYVEVVSERPGAATLTAELPGVDRVVRTLTVTPAGRRLDRAQGGTLALAREFELLAPFGAQAGASTLTLVVYPGPLGLLAGELTRAGAAPGTAEAAYAYALTGLGRDLSARLGRPLDDKVLRAARIQAYQRLARAMRSPDPIAAAVGLCAARTQPDDPLAAALTARLLDTVIGAQSPDGSFAAAWSDGSASLPRALAAAALATRCSAGLGPRVGQRAAGFAARNAGYVKDPHTAAMLLASGLVEGTQAERLRELLVAAVQTRPDGTRLVAPTAASERPDGAGLPGAVETTAWAILALADVEDQRALVGDLAGGLLGAFRADTGFGDGLASLVALEAVARVFDQPLPESVRVQLAVDGREVVSQDMTLAGAFEPLVVRAAAPATPGPHRYRLEAAPALPGLAFTLTQSSWLPWTGDPGGEGFSLAVTAAGPVAVGEPLPCRLQAAVPGDEPFRIDLDLPAGAEVEERSLAQLEQDGVILGHRASRGHLTIDAPAQPAGAVFEVAVALVPTLAGSLQWGGAALALARRPDQRVQAPVGRLEVASR